MKAQNVKDLMEKHVKAFHGIKKPVIGCLHLRPLPGTPFWDPSYSFKQHTDDLKEEAAILTELGYDAVTFANEGDIPYMTKAGPEIIASYTAIVSEVARFLTVPYGVGLQLDSYATFAVAAAVNAVFVRGIFCYTAVSDHGLINADPGAIWRYAKSIGAVDMPAYTVIEPHAGFILDQRDVTEKYLSAATNMPVTGYAMASSGKPGKDSVIARCKALNPHIPVIINSGANPDNIKAQLEYADGVIVGTYLKKDHFLFNSIDRDNARRFIEAAKG